MTGPDRDQWRVQVRAPGGAVLGAGVVLDDRHVLTCAHVVPPEAAPGPDGTRSWAELAPAEAVWIAVDGAAPSLEREARVLAEAWIPRRPGTGHSGGGDLALLELRSPLDGIAGARLHPGPVRRGSHLWAYGYPHAGTSGVWANTVAQGASGELVQMDAVPGPGAEIDRGFSGAGVVDEENRVVGLVTSRLVAEGRSIAWMMPVDTVLDYLPALRREESGAPAPTDTVPRQLAQLGRMITDLREAETAAAAVTTRFTGLPAPGRQADKYRLRLAALLLSPGSGTGSTTLRRTEHAVATALLLNRSVTEADARRRELRGRLEAGQMRAAARDRAEDPELAARFDRAATTLRQDPCDLDAGCRAVDEYELTLWRQLGLDPPAESEGA